MITPAPVQRDPDPVGLTIGDQPVETFVRRPQVEDRPARRPVAGKPTALLAMVALSVIAGIAIYTWRARRQSAY